MTQHITQGGIDLIKSFEGFDPVAKWDFHQYTNGYGTRAQYAGERITRDEAERRIMNEMSKVDNYLSSVITNQNLSPAHWAALISAGYNLGEGSLSKHGIVDAINRGDMNGAANLLRPLCHAGGKVNSVLVSRRIKECGILTGDDTFPAPALGGFARTIGNLVTAVRGLGSIVIGGNPEENAALQPPPTATSPATPAGAFNNLIKQNYEGIPYVWGQTDCSGFIQKVFKDLLHVDIPHSSKVQASYIANKFGLPLATKTASQITENDINPYCVISIKRGGTGHVLMVAVDEHNQAVSWDSRGGSRNTAANPGKGVTEGSLQQLLSRLHKEGDTQIDIVDTRKLFDDPNAVPLTADMLANAWNADLDVKQRTLAQTINNAGLGGSPIEVNITNLLGQEALLNRSTFAYSPENGRPILNVAAGMSENWTKFSVIAHMARLQHKDPGTAMLNEAVKDPEFEKFLHKLDPKKYGYNEKFFAKVEVAKHQALMTSTQANSAVNFAQNDSDLPNSNGGRVDLEASRQQETAAVFERLGRLDPNSQAALNQQAAQPLRNTGAPTFAGN